MASGMRVVQAAHDVGCSDMGVHAWIRRYRGEVAMGLMDGHDRMTGAKTGASRDGDPDGSGVGSGRRVRRTRSRGGSPTF